MKKWIFIILVLILTFAVFDFILAQENQVEINFFYSRTCPYCAQENKFLGELENKYPEIKVNRLKISERKNIDLLKKFYQEYNVPKELYGLVPITFIKGEYFSGFDEEIGEEIENCVLRLLGEETQKPCQCEKCQGYSTLIDQSRKIKLPFVGEIDISKYSLPFLTVILGTLDGFNVCSLGALILILGLVLGLKSRKKVLIFGGIFITTTAVIYGILIVLWYQLFSFFASYLKIMEILIGILAIGGGVYFLKQFIEFRKKGPTCEANTGNKLASKFSSRFQESFQKSGNIFLLIGAILLFAGIITIVEFPCTAAVPLVFSSILVQSQLSGFSYLFYIVLFLLFYMLDEIIVFLIAFFTMKIWLASSRVIVWITLVEAIVLFLLGFYYLFGFSVL